METKGKVRSFADIFCEDDTPIIKQQVGVIEIEISKLVPFVNHPFKLYEGERLRDMVTSIKELGVILPVVVRPKDKDKDSYEILSGHNRVNAAKIAGLEKVPAVIKEGLTEEEANLIVTETNLLQRSFLDLNHAERAIALSRHYNAIKGQGKRNDFIKEIEMLLKSNDSKGLETCGHNDHKLKSREKAAESYNLSGKTVARYVRIAELNPDMLNQLADNRFGFIAAYELSFISKKEEQLMLYKILSENDFDVDVKKAETLRSYSENNKFNELIVYQILSGELSKKKKSNKPAPIKIKPKVILKFFTQEQKPAEIEEVIEKALELYFSSLSEIAKSPEQKGDIE